MGSRLRRYSNLGPLTDVTFEKLEAEAPAEPEGDSLRNRALIGARQYAEVPEGWFVLTGPSGSGKTRLAAAIANRCLERGQPTLFLAVPDLMDQLRMAYAPDSTVSYDQLLDQVRNASVLALDDLGARGATPWAQEKLLQVLNHRFDWPLPTIITVRGSLDELDEGVRSRLRAQGPSNVYDLPDPATAGEPLLQAIGALSDQMRERMTFESFDPSGSIRSTPRDRTTLQAALDFARNYAHSLQGWLLLTGGTGCGKKHLSVAILNERLAAGDRCCIALVPELLDYLRAAFSPDSKVSYDERFDRIKSSPFLVLDNLGAEQSTPWAEEKLFQILEYRYNLRLPTVITSNEEMNDLEQSRPRIASRLKDILVVQWIPITAPDYRDQGAKRPPTARQGRPHSNPR